VIIGCGHKRCGQEVKAFQQIPTANFRQQNMGAYNFYSDITVLSELEIFSSNLASLGKILK